MLDNGFILVVMVVSGLLLYGISKAVYTFYKMSSTLPPIRKVSYNPYEDDEAEEANVIVLEPPPVSSAGVENADGAEINPQPAETSQEEK